ncbi:MAG: DUF4174 domain-containing protein, partial [Pseudomonadota bacterium]
QLVTSLSAADLRDAFGVENSDFRVLLIGKDGGVKLRSNEWVSAHEVFALIDTMPMRRREMQGQNETGN